MKYKKYPRYKDSGVEWLGEVPDHWNIVRNKAVFQFIKSLVGEDSKKYKLLSLTLKGIILRDIESGKGKFPAEFNTYQKVKKNDLIFCLFDIDETPRTIGISKHDGMITGAYDVARCNDKVSDSKFMYYYYLSVDEYKGLKPFYTGLRKVVRAETFMNIQLGLPPFKEQQQIAKFLDNATKKMDTLIQKQENLIKLLKEKRQAVISHAVTRGLNPDVKFKDSGVEWLGDVPEHWVVTPLRYIGRLQNGISKGAEYFGSGFPFINYGDIYKNASLPLKANGLAKSTKEDQNIYSVKKGDVFFTRTSETINDIGMASTCLQTIENATFSGFTIRFRQLKYTLNEQFSKYYFRTGHSQSFFEEQLNLVTRASLGQDILKQLPVLIPPLQEQKEIADYLDDKTKKIDKLIKKATKSIKLLKEKRTALISAAVTGKIDVREIV